MSSSHAIHIWSRCHHCGMNPIVGPRFRCNTCPFGPDTDLCATCYEGYRDGRIAHPSVDSSASVSESGGHHFTHDEGSPPGQFGMWLDIPSQAQPPPLVPSAFLVRPEFFFGRSSVFGGYGFVVWFEAHALLLTALHVMDELIKAKGIDTTARNPRNIGEELPPHVTSVRMYDVLQKQWPLYELGDAGPMLTLPHARTGDNEPFAFRDIAAFHVAAPGSLNVGQLAEQDPEPGDAVWLAAAMPDGSLTRRAVCVEQTSRSFVFRYDEAKQSAKYSSGAPILNAAGAVVGINTGLGRYAEHDIGHANPLRSIRAHLTTLAADKA